MKGNAEGRRRAPPATAVPDQRRHLRDGRTPYGTHCDLDTRQVLWTRNPDSVTCGSCLPVTPASAQLRAAASQMRHRPLRIAGDDVLAAVADWLEAAATSEEFGEVTDLDHALAVARAYLDGEQQ